MLLPLFSLLHFWEQKKKGVARLVGNLPASGLDDDAVRVLDQFLRYVREYDPNEKGVY